MLIMAEFVGNRKFPDLNKYYDLNIAKASGNM